MKMKEVYAVKWSEDQPGLVEGRPLSLGPAETEEQAKERGASHFAIPRGDVWVVEDEDRNGQPCFYVSETERQVSGLKM